MRARGLKRAMLTLKSLDLNVAPHAGAWIETDIAALSGEEAIVAPHAGVWIET